MLGTIARIAFMRVLPRRLIPLLTAWEVVRLIRGRQSKAGQPGNPADRTTRPSRRR